MPSLLRRIEIAHAREMSPEQIVNEMPAHIYSYAHASRKNVVEEVRDKHGKTIVWSVNILHVHEEYVNGTWAGDLWYSLLSEICENDGAWFRLKSGELARFRYFQTPAGNHARLVNWDRITPHHKQMLLEHLLAWTKHDRYWLDQAHHGMADWMLLDGTVEDLFGYNPMGYISGMQPFIAELRRQGRLGFLNGDRQWDQEGLPCMYENADTQHRDRFWRDAASWLAPLHRQSVFSMNHGMEEPHVYPLMNLWTHSDAVLECKDVGSADAAWRMAGD